MLHASPISAISLSMPHLFSPLSSSHTHADIPSSSLPATRVRLWWPRQVTDGDLTALLTVNWVLIKPKHVWEMLIIHCRLREAGVQPWEHCGCCMCVFCFIITSPHCDKKRFIGIITSYGRRSWELRGRMDWVSAASLDSPAPQAVSLTKINMAENLTNSNLQVLKQTRSKLSSGISHHTCQKVGC